MPVYADLTPTEAVAAARRDAGDSDDSWDALDRCLRWHLLTFLQERSGGVAELREALLEAADWAREAERSPWLHLWPYLLEILRDGERLPSAAAGLKALQEPAGKAAQVLALLVADEEPMRPGDLADRLGLSKQRVSNLGRNLEEAGLIVRHKARGRANWWYATPRGLRQKPALPRPEPTPETQSTVQRYEFWKPGKEPIPLIH